MKLLKHLLLAFSVCVGCLQCASTQKLEDNPPLGIGQISYTEQNTNSAVGSIFIPIESNPNNLQLDSILFRGKITKLNLSKKNLYSGSFPKIDFIMSDEPYAEHANELPELPPKQFSKLKAGEAVIFYELNNKTHYFKVSGVAKQ
ncbi:hypothetical protein H7U19_08580 [Hyunsoonleella sp. SJ7]|uniref:DUF4625 domain-containing protein n=1 Tax=Hyunsoonleella aquatilis TaxID=2762758 RepID=A0A923HC85_9FLAO|nr:hypothetical protein [Hyunsoonleella aquatilis]MBC3758456.1 hypothetical protein [Hyunsoonleella aquatilis]